MALAYAECQTALLAFVAHASAEGFIPPEHARLLTCATDPAALLDAFTRAYPPAEGAEGSEPPTLSTLP